MMMQTSLGDRLAPVFGRIGKLSTVQRILICTGTFLLVIALFGFLSYWPKSQRLAELEAERQDLETRLAISRRTAAQLPKLRQQLDNVTISFKTVQRALPETEEIPSLLANVSQCGRDLGLDFLLFEPKPEVNREFYAEIPVSIRVQGSYHSLGLFLDRVAKLPRIVNVLDLHLAPGGHSKHPGSALITSCTATTYKFIDSSSIPSKEKSASRKRK
ncbi:MAG: type 4a pilus biogenesis protein PilO [Desulfobacteraceae bacterium]|jgi:type IV pilus assembly protein PilO|nr:type 4a pilus biogenesis protein PilO [Desulfobacteraceae bacterium]